MKTIILAYILCSGSDAATTHYALNHGGREVLLPSQNPWAVDSMVVAETTGVGTILNKLHAHHPKLAVGLGIALVAVRGGVVVSNIHQLRK